ncbi:MAG: GNAT family N-acetyltransferase [Gaiellaceae bacterium]
MQIEAQAAYFRHLGTSRAADVFDGEGLYAVRTGVDSNTENGVVSSDTVTEAVAAELIAWLSGVPASWVCAARHEETTRVLIAAGCRPDNDAWEMHGHVGDVEVDVPDGISITAVTSERELDAWLDVAGPCGWVDTPADRRARRELHLGRGFDGPHCLYVAYRGDRPVAMASAFYTDELVYLTDLGVLDDERRRGIGRALAMTRLRDARDRGCSTAVLGASPDGAMLYRALGFETRRQPPDRWFYLPQG